MFSAGEEEFEASPTLCALQDNSRTNWAAANWNTGFDLGGWKVKGQGHTVKKCQNHLWRIRPAGVVGLHLQWVHVLFYRIYVLPCRCLCWAYFVLDKQRYSSSAIRIFFSSRATCIWNNSPVPANNADFPSLRNVNRSVPSTYLLHFWKVNFK